MSDFVRCFFTFYTPSLIHRCRPSRYKVPKSGLKMTATTEKSSPKKKGGNDKTNEEKINEIIAEGGSVIKMEVDYSSTCDEKIPQAQELAAKVRFW